MNVLYSNVSCGGGTVAEGLDFVSYGSGFEYSWFAEINDRRSHKVLGMETLKTIL